MEEYTTTEDILTRFSYWISDIIASLVGEVTEADIRAEVREAWNNVHPSD